MGASLAEDLDLLFKLLLIFAVLFGLYGYPSGCIFY